MGRALQPTQTPHASRRGCANDRKEVPDTAIPSDPRLVPFLGAPRGTRWSASVPLKDPITRNPVRIGARMSGKRVRESRGKVRVEKPENPYVSRCFWASSRSRADHGCQGGCGGGIVACEAGCPGAFGTRLVLLRIPRGRGGRPPRPWSGLFRLSPGQSNHPLGLQESQKKSLLQLRVTEGFNLVGVKGFEPSASTSRT